MTIDPYYFTIITNVPKYCKNSAAEWKWHPKMPKKAKKRKKCDIFSGPQSIFLKIA